jgi:hypothetical protein
MAERLFLGRLRGLEQMVEVGNAERGSGRCLGQAACRVARRRDPSADRVSCRLPAYLRVSPIIISVSSSS